MSNIALEFLIQEHKERIAQLKYSPNPPGCWGFSYYYYDDSESYQKWLATTKRFISSHSFCGLGIQGQLDGVMVAQGFYYAGNHLQV